MRTVLYSCLAAVALGAPAPSQLVAEQPGPAACEAAFATNGVWRNEAKVEAAMKERVDFGLTQHITGKDADPVKFVQVRFAEYEKRLNDRAIDCRPGFCEAGAGFMRAFIDKSLNWKSMGESMNVLISAEADGALCSTTPARTVKSSSPELVKSSESVVLPAPGRRKGKRTTPVGRVDAVTAMKELTPV